MTLLHSLYDHSFVLLFHNTQLLRQSHQIGDVPSHPDGMGACGYIPYQLLHSACRTEPSVTTSSLACSQVRWALLGKWDQGEGTTDSFSNSLQKKNQESVGSRRGQGTETPYLPFPVQASFNIPCPKIPVRVVFVSGT